MTTRRTAPRWTALNEQAEPEARHAGAEPGDHEHPKHPRLHALRERLHGYREHVRRRPGLNITYRVVLGVFGTAVLVAGLLMIPYPGPGWLVVFAGLGILATEFHWAHRVNMFAKRHYQRWVRWLGRQHLATKLTIMAVTGLVVVVTLWLLGMFGTIGGWLGLRWTWLASPLFGP
ncbi:TIGR02611 family protein [Saccharopolyspora mangrovi]|uniref:TIGR02611 family protein n=1 Tax=Saccharopolyspora mangrovi TaxID=3082379 RepID=A0ABU6A8N1_9PSEU|nr:TIGR02611 family protein [Saccharopolyspora sp. S2-29]MEB3367769.1 TIGR02611 family protein [Saccharopolyspora sp. S2-29]